MSADLDAFNQYFVSLAERIPEVQEVRRSVPRDDPRIWTVIRAEPFDDSKTKAVFQAEMTALVAFPSVNVDFQLVNLEEHREPDFLFDSKHSAVLWRRPAA